MSLIITAVLIGLLAVIFGITNMVHDESRHDDVEIEIKKTRETKKDKEDKDKE